MAGPSLCVCLCYQRAGGGDGGWKRLNRIMWDYNHWVSQDEEEVEVEESRRRMLACEMKFLPIMNHNQGTRFSFVPINASWR